MQFLHIMKRLGQSAGETDALDEDDAYHLFSAMLDGGLPDLELGAAITALHFRIESTAELLGLHRAVCERSYVLNMPDTHMRPLVIPAYGGARREPNLLPLLGLLLRRLGVPVVFHGTLEGSGYAAAVYILREFGVLPSATVSQAQTALLEDGIAYLPVGALCPGLAALLALRNRLGMRNSAHVAAKILDPFAGAGVVMAGASSTIYLDRLAAFFVASGTAGLLLASTEGEPFANPRRRPRIEFFNQGERRILFEEEAGPVKSVAGLPAAIDTQATAAWMQAALSGEALIPHPLVNQLACCLYAVGYTDDMNQAKAIAAVEAGSLGVVGRRRIDSGRASRSPTH
ncbi:MAG: DNA-binding protein YbiB [Burkholderiales bacterium]|nr:DNA-binding protein YbiB [Burkholderiales bacterium]